MATSSTPLSGPPARELIIFVSEEIARRLPPSIRLSGEARQQFTRVPERLTARQILNYFEGLLDGFKCRMVPVADDGGPDWSDGVKQVTSVRRRWSDQDSGRVGAWFLAALFDAPASLSGPPPNPLSVASAAPNLGMSFSAAASGHGVLEASPSATRTMTLSSSRGRGTTETPQRLSFAATRIGADTTEEPSFFPPQGPQKKRVQRLSPDALQAATTVLYQRGWGLAPQIAAWGIDQATHEALKTLKARLCARLHDLFRVNSKTPGFCHLREFIIKGVDEGNATDVLVNLAIAKTTNLATCCDDTARALLLKALVACDKYRAAAEGRPRAYSELGNSDSFIRPFAGADVLLLRVSDCFDNPRTMELVSPGDLPSDDPLLRLLPPGHPLRPSPGDVAIPAESHGALSAAGDHASHGDDATALHGAHEALLSATTCADTEVEPVASVEREVECGGEGDCLFLSYAYLVHGLRGDSSSDMAARKVRSCCVFRCVLPSPLFRVHLRRTAESRSSPSLDGCEGALRSWHL